MEPTEIALIASNYVIYFSLIQEVRDQSYTALRNRANANAELAAIINANVKPATKVTEAEMPAVRKAIQQILNALPAMVHWKDFAANQTFEWFDIP